MAEISILDMTNEQILELIQRNKLLREQATQEKQVTREKEKNVKETKVKAKAHASAATDILKAYLDGNEKKPLTKEKARDAAGDILKQYMESQQKGKSK